MVAFLRALCLGLVVTLSVGGLLATVSAPVLASEGGDGGGGGDSGGGGGDDRGDSDGGGPGNTERDSAPTGFTGSTRTRAMTAPAGLSAAYLKYAQSLAKKFGIPPKPPVTVGQIKGWLNGGYNAIGMGKAWGNLTPGQQTQFASIVADAINKYGTGMTPSPGPGPKPPGPGPKPPGPVPRPPGPGPAPAPVPGPPAATLSALDPGDDDRGGGGDGGRSPSQDTTQTTPPAEDVDSVLGDLLGTTPPTSTPEDLADLSTGPLPGTPPTESIGPTDLDVVTTGETIAEDAEVTITGEPPNGSTPTNETTQANVKQFWQENKKNWDEEKRERWADYWTGKGVEDNKYWTEKAATAQSLEDAATTVKTVADVTNTVLGLFVPVGAVAEGGWKTAQTLATVAGKINTAYNDYQKALAGGLTPAEAAQAAFGAQVSQAVLDKIKGIATGKVKEVRNAVVGMGTTQATTVTDKVANGIVSTVSTTVAAGTNFGIGKATAATQNATKTAVAADIKSINDKARAETGR